MNELVFKNWNVHINLTILEIETFENQWTV